MTGNAGRRLAVIFLVCAASVVEAQPATRSRSAAPVQAPRPPNVLLAPGTESAAPVMGYDLLPTFAALTGAAVPADRPIDGEDVSPVLRGEAFARRRPLYWEFEDDQGFHYALRDGDAKLITDRTFEKRRLYDLAHDRFEVEDRAAAEPTLLAALLARLSRVAADVAADPLRPR